MSINLVEKSWNIINFKVLIENKLHICERVCDYNVISVFNKQIVNFFIVTSTCFELTLNKELLKFLLFSYN